MQLERIAGLGAFILVAACGSYAKDAATMCEAPNKADVPAGFDPSQKATVMAAWIDGKLGSEEGRALFAKLATVPPADRARLLREAASANAVKTCPLADFYEANAQRK